MSEPTREPNIALPCHTGGLALFLKVRVRLGNLPVVPVLNVER